MKPGKRLFLILLIPGIVGCQKVSEGKAQLAQLLLLNGASAKVTQAGGGTLTGPTMSLTVPQGALEEDTTITYTETSLPGERDATVPLQAAYSFGPEGLQFNKPAAMKICYDAQDVQARGLNEKTMQIQYHDPETDELVSMGGEVDLANHCVSAQIYHFSTYILTAQILAVGNNAPTIGGAQFFPSRPIAGLPLTVRTSITDWDGGSAIATARFYYRTAGAGGAFKSVGLSPDENDGSGQFYTAKIPATDITAAGLNYYIQAFDSLNARSARPATAPAAFSTIVGDSQAATTPIRFQTTVTQMSAGFSRDLTVQVRGSSSATYYPVPADTLTFTGKDNTTSRPTWLSARYTARTIGNPSLEATYGSLTLSVPIHVYPGVLNRIAVLYQDTVLPDPFVVYGSSEVQLDAAGYDAYDNFMFVQPVFGASVGIGTFGNAANYGKFTAADVLADTEGTITVVLGGYSVTYNTRVLTTHAFCHFDVGSFDADCVFH